MGSTPGTVSKILWHFTGGPKWNPKTQRQRARPKPETDAYKALLSILKSHELRLGGYREVVNIVVSEIGQWNRETRKIEIQKDVPFRLESAPVCCLSDIPIVHLRYHADRYGRFALGFYRDAAIEHGFNPVFYTLPHNRILQAIYGGLSQLAAADASEVSWHARHLREEIDAAEGRCFSDFDIGGTDELCDVGQKLEDAINEAQAAIQKFLAYVKTFDKSEFDSIFCEREWRAVRPFNFPPEALAMIVVPREGKEKNYYADLISKVKRRTVVDHRIPIVPWEDLIEH